MEIIKLSNVSFYYPNGSDESILALKDVSFSISEGEFVVILGHNGSGKSTVAKLFNGLLTPDAGTVESFGMDTADRKNLFEIRKKVGVVFQNPDSFQAFNVMPNVFGREDVFDDFVL